MCVVSPKLRIHCFLPERVRSIQRRMPLWWLLQGQLLPKRLISKNLVFSYLYSFEFDLNGLSLNGQCLTSECPSLAILRSLSRCCGKQRFIVVRSSFHFPRPSPFKVSHEC